MQRVQPIHKASMLKAVRTNKVWFGYMAPNLVNAGNINNGWHLGIDIIVSVDREGNYHVVSENAQDDEQLHSYINSFLYYNGNRELGKSVKFWEGI